MICILFKICLLSHVATKLNETRDFYQFWTWPLTWKSIVDQRMNQRKESFKKRKFQVSSFKGLSKARIKGVDLEICTNFRHLTLLQEHVGNLINAETCSSLYGFVSCSNFLFPNSHYGNWPTWTLQQVFLFDFVFDVENFYTA